MPMGASQLVIKKHHAFVLVACWAHSHIALSASREPPVELHEPSVASERLVPMQVSVAHQMPVTLRRLFVVAATAFRGLPMVDTAVVHKAIAA